MARPIQFTLCSLPAYPGRMPPGPTFLLDLQFRDLTEWWLHLQCCGRTVNLPFRLLAAQKPMARLGELLRALRCRTCNQRPGRAVLLINPADRAASYFGSDGGWRIEIVLPDVGGW